MPSPLAQPPGNELSALSWSRSSLYSQWREMGTGATVPVTVGSPRQHPEAKGFGFPPSLNACEWVGKNLLSAPMKSRLGG